ADPVFYLDDIVDHGPAETDEAGPVALDPLVRHQVEYKVKGLCHDTVQDRLAAPLGQLTGNIVVTGKAEGDHLRNQCRRVGGGVHQNHIVADAVLHGGGKGDLLVVALGKHQES